MKFSAEKAKNNGFKIIGLTASSVEDRNIFIKKIICLSSSIPAMKQH